MGGAARAIGLGGSKTEQVVQSIKAAEPKASRMDEEQGARMRGARRRGRALLSDARLSSETGIETLGGGQSLG
jgi:hypothetical protein